MSRISDQDITSQRRFSQEVQTEFLLSDNERIKLAKRLKQLCSNFASILLNEWINLDDQLQDVISSIVNIRYRLPIEYQMYLKAETGPNDDNLSSFDMLYRPNLKSDHLDLHRDDLWLGLSHDAIQHEKMLAHVRTLMMQLNQAHDALGRQLDKAMQFQFDSSIMINEAINTEASMGLHAHNKKGTVVSALENIIQMRSLYKSLSNELLRKQIIAKEIVSSIGGVNSGVPLEQKKDELDLNQLWSRQSKNSLVDFGDMKEFLNNFKGA